MPEQICSKRKKMAKAEKTMAEPEEMMAEPEKIPFERGVPNLLRKMNGISHGAKEVFLWELVRNSACALYKFRRATLYEPDLIGNERGLFIDIFPDKSNKTLSIVDNGIGMTEDDLKERLFTIPKPCLEKYKKTVDKLVKSKIKVDEFYSDNLEARLGFLAAYMVADKVEITTKHHAGDRECMCFSSTSERSFSLVDRSCTVSSARGTKVTLQLNSDYFEYLDECRLKGLIDKITFDLCPYPVSIHVLHPCTNVIQRYADLEEKKKDMALMKKEFEGLRRLFKKVLGSQVKKVVVSNRIYDLPCVLSLDKKTFEINPRSPLVEKLKQEAERNPKDEEVVSMINLQFEAGRASILLYDVKHGTRNYLTRMPAYLLV